MRKRAIGYARRDPVSHRKYNIATAMRRYSRTGKYHTVDGGSGHRAGESWGAKKNIPADHPVTRYGKNSPSFDEGVAIHKYKAKKRELSKKKQKVGKEYWDSLYSQAND